MRIMTRGALHLVSCKGLNPIGKHSSPILFRNGGLIESRVKIKGWVGHGDGVVISQVLRQITDGGVMGSRQAPVGPFLSIVTLSATIAANRPFEIHPIMRTGFHDVMVFGLVKNCDHRHGAVMT